MNSLITWEKEMYLCDSKSIIYTHLNKVSEIEQRL